MPDERKEELNTETRLALLDSSRRRLVLTALESRDSVAFSDLVDVIAQAENEGEEISKNDRKTVHVALLQTHLPRLEDHDVVEWDRDQKVIHRGPTFGELYCALEGVRPGGCENGLVNRVRRVFK